MSPRNRLQFAVTREDPNVELEVLARFPRSRLLLIASGGCTALTLRAVMPDAHITLVDANPEQLAHVDRKLAALRDLRGADRLRAFNVGEPSDPSGLSECGNFESLFRGLRGFVQDFVLPREAWLRFFGEGAFDVASCTPRSRTRTGPWRSSCSSPTRCSTPCSGPTPRSTPCRAATRATSAS
jgi:hypothetical protein